MRLVVNEDYDPTKDYHIFVGSKLFTGKITKWAYDVLYLEIANSGPIGFSELGSHVAILSNEHIIAVEEVS